MKRISTSVIACLIAVATLLAMALSANSVALADTAGRIAIDSTNATVKYQQFKDEKQTQPIDQNTPINRGDTIYASLNINFITAFPGIDQAALEYDFPDNINVGNVAQQPLYDDSGEAAGTWSIANNKILVDYDPQFLATHTTGLKLHFNFNFLVNSDSSQDNNQTTIEFPGGASAVINFNPAQVSSSKSATIDADGKTVHFTTNFTADANTTNFAFNDEMQNGFTFVSGTFKFDSNELGQVAINNSADPRTASATIGDLTKGNHTLTYDAVLTDSAQQDLLSGKTPELTNILNSTWDKNSHGSAQTTPNLTFSGVKKGFVGYHNDTAIADWNIKVNGGTYKADMAGMTITDNLLPAQKIGDDDDPNGAIAQQYVGSYVVKDNQGNTIGTGQLDPAQQSFSYTFPTDKTYSGTYTIEYSTKLDNPNVQRKYNNNASISKAGTVYGTDTAAYQRTGGFNDVHKAAPTLNSDGTITWTVSVNGGEFKRNLAGVLFKDSLSGTEDGMPGMHYVGNYTVTRAADHEVMYSGPLPNAQEFTYEFPEDAGFNNYIITYNTALDDPTYLVNYANTADVSGGSIPGDGSKSVAHYDNTYSGQDSTFLTKSVTDNDAIDSGVVGWKVDIKPGVISNNQNLSFADHLDQGWAASGVDYNHDSLKVNGKDINEQSAVKVVWGRYSKANNGGICSADDTSKDDAPCFSLDIADSALSNAVISITYNTTAKNPNIAGTYQNTATLTKDAATFNASADVTVPENAIQKSGNATWDNDTKTWGIDYTVDINANNNSSLHRAGIDNLHGKPVILTDILGADSGNHPQTYVHGTASYTLNLAGKEAITRSIEPEVADSGSKLTFTVPTEDICDNSPDQSCYASIQLQYRVTVPTDPYRSSTYANTISGKNDDALFTDGTSTTTVDTNVLVKDGQPIPGQPQIGYFIKVNEHGGTINSGSPLELADSLDYRTSLVPSSILVCKGDIAVDKNTGSASCTSGKDSDITASSKVQQEIGSDDGQHPIDVLNVTIPDGTFATVYYRAMLNGKVGSTLNGVSNKAVLKGIVNSNIENKKDFLLTEASGGTSAATGAITVRKVDADNASRSLAGAEFTLYRVSDTNWNDESDVADHAVEVARKTTDQNGCVSFDQDGATALKLNTLYYYIESKAPQSYHLDSAKRFFILEDSTDQGTFNAQMLDAKAKLGEFPAQRTYYTANDSKLTPVKFGIEAKKVLKGRALQAGEFRFSLHDGDANGPVIATSTNAADGTVQFEEINYDHEGSFVYTITEDGGNAGGISYSKEAIPVTVTTKDNGSGVLTATPSYQGTGIPEINNSYSAKGTFTPEGIKVLEGREAISTDSFGFTIKDAHTGAVVSTGAISNLSESNKIVFTPIDYGLQDAGKTFQYVVSENTVDDSGKSLLPLGMSATTGSQVFSVAVSDNGDGTLKIMPNYPESAQGMSFVNTYSTNQEAPLAINGTKVLTATDTDTTLADFAGKFHFTLSGVDDAKQPAPLPSDANGKTMDSATNDPLGNISFGSIVYRQADLADAQQAADGSRTKVFHYTVSEDANQPSGVTADSTANRYFDVSVKDDGLGHITAIASAVEPPQDGLGSGAKNSGGNGNNENAKQPDEDGENNPVLGGLFSFTNTYTLSPLKSAVSDGIHVFKVLRNRQLQNGEFSFLLTDKQTGKVLETAVNNAQGAVKFNALTYTKPGKYEYSVSESIPASAVNNAQGNPVADGITYDSKVVDVQVTVIDNHDGTMTAATAIVDGSGKTQSESSVVFTNIAPLPTPLASTGSTFTPVVMVSVVFALLAAGVEVLNRKTVLPKHGSHRSTEEFKWL